MPNLSREGPSPVPGHRPGPQRPRQPRHRGSNGACRCGARWQALNLAHCGSCHRSFSSPSLFDQHRSAAGERGTCADPAAITKEDGTPVMYYRDGVWQWPPMPVEVIALRRRAGE